MIKIRGGVLGKMGLRELKETPLWAFKLTTMQMCSCISI